MFYHVCLGMCGLGQATVQNSPHYQHRHEQMHQPISLSGLESIGLLALSLFTVCLLQFLTAI